MHVTATLASMYRPTDMVSVTAIPLSVIDSFLNVLVGPIDQVLRLVGYVHIYFVRKLTHKITQKKDMVYIWHMLDLDLTCFLYDLNMGTRWVPIWNPIGGAVAKGIYPGKILYGHTIFTVCGEYITLLLETIVVD